MASVRDHQHNILVAMDLTDDSRQVVHNNGDFDRIIVDLAFVAGYTAICDLDHVVSLFVADVKVRQLDRRCFFQGNRRSSDLEYYAMSKIFTHSLDTIFFIDHDDRSRVVAVHLGIGGVSDRLISFPQPDLFQVSFDGRGLLAGVGEQSSIVSYVDVMDKDAVIKSIELKPGSND